MFNHYGLSPHSSHFIRAVTPREGSPKLTAKNEFEENMKNWYCSLLRDAGTLDRSSE